jgi:hypothetical protein
MQQSAPLSSSMRPDGRRLEQMRVYSGLTLFDVAAKLSVHPSTIAAAERSAWVGRDLVSRLESFYLTLNDA